MIKKFLFFIFCSVVFLSCRKEPEKEIVQESSPDYEEVLRAAVHAATNGNPDTLLLPEEGDLSSIPQDWEYNPITPEKVELGKMLFHETALSRSGNQVEGYETYSCASCHHAAAGFTAGLPQGVGDGGVGFGMAGEGRSFSPAYSVDSVDAQSITPPTVMNVAFQEVMFWNGQFGATGPNEYTEGVWEMGSPEFFNQFGYQGPETRAIAGFSMHGLEVTSEFTDEFPEYKDLFDNAFPDWTPISNRYTNRTAGLAIAAYLRTIFSNEAPWQDWLKGESDALSESEKRGAIVFFGEGDCYSCHNGPALNSMSFYALGMNDLQDRPGIVIPDEDHPAFLGRGGFTMDYEDNYKFKTPQLYNLKDDNSFGHGASFNTVQEVIQYKNAALPENQAVPFNRISPEFIPLGLSNQQIEDLVSFLLHGLYDDDLQRYVPQETPTGLCFPNNDPQSQIDLGCQ